MYNSAALLCLFLFISHPSAGASAPDGVLRKRQLTSSALNEWVKGEEAHGDLPISIHIALTQSDTERGVEYLLDISDPQSPRFGQHWTAAEVAHLFAPPPQALQSALVWLGQFGINSTRITRSHGGGFLRVESTVGEVGRLLSTRLHHFTRRGHGETRVISDEYHIPEHLSAAIEYISTIDSTTLPVRTASHATIQRRQSGGATVNCHKYTAPSCLRDIYGIPETTAPHPNSSLGIYQSAWVTWLAEDLDLFFDVFQPGLKGRRPVVERVNGGFMQTDIKISPFNLEPNLDFQYAIALTNPQDVINIQVGHESRLGNLNNMLAAFDEYYCGAIDPSIDPTLPGPENATDCGTLAPPTVLSITFGDSEANFPPEYLKRQCLEFLKLGLLGVTVVVASGDTGTESGYFPGTCIDPDTGASNVTGGHFNPVWPSACPWVTSVGGTQLSTHETNTTTEVAWNMAIGANTASSGGGFSNIFAAPPYQLRAVADYETKEESHTSGFKGLYNRHGRGTPDVSALAASYLIALHGNITTVSGTSASAPVFASVISMINNERLHAGKGPVGFVNPALYGNPEALNDVTRGGNEGCGANPAFRATEGWDAVTGLGSPDFRRLRQLFMSLA